MSRLIVFSILVSFSNGHQVSVRQTGPFHGCYDAEGVPQRCVPGFKNVALQIPVEVTNTCGMKGPSQFCLPTAHFNSISKRTCQVCDARNPQNAHPSSFLTDNNETTYWQSDTMHEGIQWPNQVNLTLHLGKSFEVTYIHLKFKSPRPESFAIYKRHSEDGPWLPFHFYSANCSSVYGLRDFSYIHDGNDARALCTSEFSEISPLTGGEVAFPTLEGRQTSHNFDYSGLLQDWVTATDIRISLNRLNTFGDEVFGDEKVLRSYFYAISDFAVGGRCKCHGHASECIKDKSNGRLVCKCEHNTAGTDCEKCHPLYNDQPWRRANAQNGHECKPCNCNGFSDRCYFDQELYEATGHGGHCTDCRGNKDGPNCEKCMDNFFQGADGNCMPCDCSEIGSRRLQCNGEGQCPCKAGVTGDKCDSCHKYYYDFGEQGCKHCLFSNKPYRVCDTITTDSHENSANVKGHQSMLRSDAVVILSLMVVSLCVI